MVANTSFLSQAKTVFPRSFYNEIWNWNKEFMP
jgi:hypothetical protein